MQISLLLDRTRGDTLTAQLVGQLRDAIRLGRIAPGARLPSSRRLSEQLGIGRNTVVRAYETLEIECFVESRPASGMFAACPPAAAPARPLAKPPGERLEEPPGEPPGELQPATPAMSRAASRQEPRPGAYPARAASPNGTWSGIPADARAMALVTSHMPAARFAPASASRARLAFDFAPGLPNANLFPLKTWRRLLQSCLSRGGPPGLTQAADLFGLPALRSAIANHLGAARGIVAEPGQIAIVSGAREAIAIATRLFVRPGVPVCVEDPCYRPAAAAFQAAGADLRALPVDENGILADELPPRSAALLYVTPAHQYPTGHTMSGPRREQIAEWARASGCIILEDDRGADFRYEGGAPCAVAAYAPDHTVHFGTFSQSLGAGLGLGYMVVPPGLVDAVRAAKVLMTGGGPWLEQAALAELIERGGFASHIMRMRVEYRDRRDHLLDALRRDFGDLEISGETSGLHVFWQLPPGVPDAATVEALGRRARVGVCSFGSAGVHHSGPTALSRRGLILGYAALTPKQIDQGIARLSDAVDDALDGHAIGLSDLLAHRPRSPGPLSGRGPIQNRRRPPKPAPSAKPVPRTEPVPRDRHQPALPASAPYRAASTDMAARGPGKPMTVVTGLYQYPIKGLSPRPVARVRVAVGQPFPFDRIFALARPGVAVTREEPKWAKKGLFVMLMLDEGLARVRTDLDPETLLLTVRDLTGKLLLEANLDEAAARRDVEAFFHRLAPTLRAAPALVRARDGHFMDKPDNVISLINLATVRALEQQWSIRIDPLRFRANIYIDGAPPWEEFAWVGGDIRLGDALFRADRRNGRCGATNVDPASGQRDLDIPGSLRRTFGHKDLGIYLLARADAELSVGDALVHASAPGARKPAPPHGGPAAGRGAFICQGCYFVYDEAQGLPLAGIVSGTRFAELPAAWQCPDCGTDKTTFRPHLEAT